MKGCKASYQVCFAVTKTHRSRENSKTVENGAIGAFDHAGFAIVANFYSIRRIVTSDKVR